MLVCKNNIDLGICNEWEKLGKKKRVLELYIDVFRYRRRRDERV